MAVVKRNLRLRRWLSQIRTLNSSSLAHAVHRKKFASSFGGFWTDRIDYPKLRDRKVRAGTINRHDCELLDHWSEKGFVILKQAVSTKLVDDLISDLNQLPANAAKKILITGGKEVGARAYDPKSVRAHESIRIIDFYFYSEAARKLLFADPIVHFFKLVFENSPILNQSLSFEYGSEQAIHQDTAFVGMNSPRGLAACWIALEDVQEGSGELIYYPGSHKWKDFLFSGYSKHFSKDRDGVEQLNIFHSSLHEQAKIRKVEVEKFKAKKGDVLIWHADLAHGGAPILNGQLTRRSLVGHYCPGNVRPMYHYWKPSFRKVYSYHSHKYMSGNYIR